MANRIPRPAGKPRRPAGDPVANAVPRRPARPVEEAVLIPSAAIATACLVWFSLSRPSPASLAVLLAAILALSTPVFLSIRSRWLASTDRRRTALLGTLAGLMLLSAAAAMITVAGLILA